MRDRKAPRDRGAPRDRAAPGGWPVLAAVTLLAMAAAGCGTVTAQPARAAAARIVPAAGSSRVTVAVTFGKPGSSIHLTGSGAFDYTRQVGWLNLRGAGAAMEERLIPPRMYVKVPAGTLGAGGKTWLARTVDGRGARAAVPLMYPGPQADPAALLAALSGITGPRRDLGTATLRGTRVTHYRVRIDVATAVSRAKAWERAWLRSVLGALGTPAFPADLWVDSGGLVRRIVVTVATRSGVTAETVSFYDFGVPVRVTAPPPASVAPAGTSAAVVAASPPA